MIAVVAISPVVLILIIIVIALLAIGPRTYGTYVGYGGPPLDWLWILVVIIVILWLLGAI